MSPGDVVFGASVQWLTSSHVDRTSTFASHLENAKRGRIGGRTRPFGFVSDP